MTQRYAVTDPDGRLLAFYADDVFPDRSQIPSNAVPISESDWAVWCCGQDAFRLVGGVLTPYIAPLAAS